MSRNSSSEKTFGYLTSIESVEYGYFGGYLVVSHLGRPMEFHCTAPICPSRAQRILYGPTLEPYLLGEQVADALLYVAKLTPLVILTDCDTMLHARPRFDVPMAWLRALPPMDAAIGADQPAFCSEASASSSTGDFSSPLRTRSGEFALGDYRVHLPLGYETDENLILEALRLLSQHVELLEPFSRIHEAIGEAQRIGSRGTESYDQAA